MNNVTSSWDDISGSENYSSGLPYTFTDLYGKLSFNGATGSKVNLFGFSFNDMMIFFSIS